MRDAFGGSFMIQLFLVFIIIYVSFTAIALNYAKAFKAKNIVVSYLEEKEISSVRNNDLSTVVYNEMNDYFANKLAGELNYRYPISTSSCTASNPRNTVLCFNDLGVKIEQIEPNDEERNKLGVYYKVTTYFGFQLPFFDRLYAISGADNGQNVIGKWTIVGETRPIAYE